MKTETAHKIPYGRQSISAADIEAVVEVLNSDWLTQGPSIDAFERAVADYCGVKHAVAFCNATAALHIACMAIDLRPGDVLWTSPNTFVASANCARYCGADVDFVDINPRTLNMDGLALERKLKAAKAQGRLPKAVIPVHFAGQPCEMAAIRELSKQYGFSVIEDASHAIGGRYKREPIGNCRYSDMTVFSFHPVKVMTTGEGGMVMTDSDKLREKLARLRTHGITRDPKHMVSPPDGPWDYQQIDLGYNYRITDMQAALGLSQLKRLDEFVAKRHELVAKYNEGLKGLPLALPYEHADSYSAYHLYVIRVRPEARLNRAQLFDKLRAAGILVNVHYIPVHTQPYYQDLGFKPGDFPESEHYYSETITLPLYFGLTDEDQKHVIDTLRNALG